MARRTIPTSARKAPTLVSVAEAAEILGVNPKTLRRWIAAGRLEAYRVGPRALRVDLDELLAVAKPLRTA